VVAFAIEGDIDLRIIKSNTLEIEWPPKDGKMQSFPEIDCAAWFDLPIARVKRSAHRTCGPNASEARAVTEPFDSPALH
jgi:predicted NUDIX family NTP pyrophosphohydrolase